MNKFLFKSADADFQKLYQLLITIQKNVLYSTHRIDFLVKELKKLTVDKGIQQQVDEYFETSHQTDIEDKLMPEEDAGPD